MTIILARLSPATKASDVTDLLKNSELPQPSAIDTVSQETALTELGLDHDRQDAKVAPTNKHRKKELQALCNADSAFMRLCFTERPDRKCPFVSDTL